MIFHFIKHEGGNSVASIGTIASLTADLNDGLASAVLILGAGNGMRRGRHWVAVIGVEITEVVDGERPANGVPYIPSRLGQ